MNLLKQLWNWFTTPNTDDCCDAEVCEEATPVEVEEEPEQDIAELFESVCAQLGLGDNSPRDSVQHKSLLIGMMVPQMKNL